MKCKHCGETGHKFVCCPDQVCNVCSGKGHAPEICDNNLTALACVDSSSRIDDGGADVSSEGAESFMCDVSGSYLVCRVILMRRITESFPGRWGISR